MLIFDKTYALIIAIVFGLAGLPWSFWLFRKDKESGLFEKTIIGYTLGLVLVPFLFLIEYLLGILYEPSFVYVNWLLIFISGAYFAFKDKAFKIEFDTSGIFTQQNLAKLAIFAVMISTFVIGFSVTGTPIMDLDPYFYLDGVRQVVYEGHNFVNDQTAWYPEAISSHLGNPIWKYMLASWFSVYNGDIEYSPYTLLGVGGVYPPIIGALAAFFAYFLFKHLYNYRVGVLAGGIIAFLPILLIKFQGGDFQIEPYNIFAFVFLMGAFAYALKKNTRESWAFMFVSCVASFLGSNLASLVLFVFSLSIFAIGISQFIQPTEEGAKREKTLGYFVGSILLCELFLLVYYMRAGADFLGPLKTILPFVLIPAGAFIAAWAIVRFFSDAKNELSGIKKKLNIGELKLDLWSRIGVLAVIGIIGIMFVFVARDIPVIDNVVENYVLFGAYSEPLYRTIAEQAPGSEYYNGQLGILAMPFSGVDNSGGDLLSTAYNLKANIAGALNVIPNAIVNLVYGIFIAIMNSISGSDTFQKVDKGNSMLTLIVFWGIAALFGNMIYSIYKKKTIGLDSLLILPFVIPVVLMAFGKAKLVMYLALAVVFLAGATWGNLEKAVKLVMRWYYSGKMNEKDMKDEKKKEIGDTASPAGQSSPQLSAEDEQKLVARIFKYGAIVAVLLIVLAQFGPAYVLSFTIPGQEPASGLFVNLANSYGYGALPLFIYSFEPRIYDNPQKVLVKLEKYCALTGDSSICSRVQDWENTINDPVKYYERNLCARSLWPYADKSPTLGTQIAIGYRCSMVADYWLAPMEWIRQNVPADKPGSRIISWWDYGHWINYFGEKNTVLRNEHASTEMIGKTAYSFLHADAKFLRETMKEYDSRYLLVDVEILGNGADKNNIQLGGKYSALNYLGCAWANQTTVENWPGQSDCENSHLWETVVVPQKEGVGGEPCTISSSRGINGIIGYRILRQKDGNSIPQAQYCFAQEYVNGATVIKAYSLNKKDANGDLEAVEVEWRGYNDANGIVLTAFYSSASEDAAPFYKSNVYTAFFLDEVEGFELVYSSPQIRIFRMTDTYWN